MKKNSFIMILFLLLLSGCAGFGSKSLDFHTERGLENKQLSPRSAPAKVTGKSSDALKQEGYLVIGHITNEEIIKTCWVGSDCYASISSCPSASNQRNLTDELIQKVASYGGDLIAIERDNKMEIRKTSKQGKCIATGVSDYTLSGGKRTFYCAEWETIDGTECVLVSSGTIWRHDPELAKWMADRAKNFRAAYSSFLECSGGLSPFQAENNKWGYSKDGKIAIEPQFDQAQAFISENLAIVKIGDKEGYIDKDGKIVIEPQFDQAWAFSEGLARVKIGDKFGYIDKTGTFTIRPQFRWAGEFKEGLAKAGIGEFLNYKWGYINKQGEYIIQPQFGDCGPFHDGLAAASLSECISWNSDWGYIDKTGKWVIRPIFLRAGVFSEGLAPVAIGSLITKKWGYIDKEGKVVIKPQFDEAFPFSEGLAAVKMKDKYGYINKTGEFIIKPSYSAVTQFINGIAQVQVDNEFGFIGKTGELILEPADIEIPIGRLSDPKYWF